MRFSASFAGLVALVPLLFTNVSAQDADAQTSLTLDPAVIAPGFAFTGQEVPVAGQAESLTSTNNFINFCKDIDLPLTDGKQIVGGSCNPAPMGAIPANTNMPTSKFVNPVNLQVIAPNTAFTITMAIQGMQTGAFVNAQANYFSAPQQLNGQGQIIGHSHVVIEKIDSLQQITPTNALDFAFFKGLNDAAAGGVLIAEVSDGLPAGTYKLSSINTAANHQPLIVPVAQHGSLDDAVYFIVSDDANAAPAVPGAAPGADVPAAEPVVVAPVVVDGKDAKAGKNANVGKNSNAKGAKNAGKGKQAKNAGKAQAKGAKNAGKAQAKNAGKAQAKGAKNAGKGKAANAAKGQGKGKQNNDRRHARDIRRLARDE